jgi:hypothetical protein
LAHFAKGCLGETMTVANDTSIRSAGVSPAILGCVASRKIAGETPAPQRIANLARRAG